jgi:hypothetical protein
MPHPATPRKLPALPPAARCDTRAAAATCLSPAARALHRAILHAFAETGRAPAPQELDRQAGTPLDTRAALAELLAADAVVLDAGGAVVAAYPFSATRTLHRVEIRGGPTVFAMCAVDALGTSAMLGRPVTVTAREPDSDRQVRIEVDGGTAAFEPESAVVFAGTTGDWCCGPAATQRCGTINFFTTAQAAESWAARHPEVTGQVLDQRQALAWGVREFAGLLGRDGPSR